MENASKALIIAGAILISIILITIGISIITAGQDVVGQGEQLMDAQAIQTFNQRFLQYAGTKRGSAVKALVQEVMANNSSESQAQKISMSSTSATLTLTTTEDVKEISKIIGDIKGTAKYEITINIGDNGLVESIEIADPT